MKTLPALTLIAAALLPLADDPLAAAPELKTKIAIDAEAAKERFDDGTPCFVVYPDGEPGSDLRESGAARTIEAALSKMGYALVGEEAQAAVFIKVDYAQFEPFPSAVEVQGRSRIDYANAMSARNHAAMMMGGRYQKLANPQRNRETNNVEALLGPSGEIIQLADQEPNVAKVLPGESATALVTLHPIALEVSAWRFDKDSLQTPPATLWRVAATYNNLHDEEVLPQLKALSQAASRYFGKRLKSTKFVSRK